MELIVTTAGRRNSTNKVAALDAAAQLGGTFYNRIDESVSTLKERYQADILVAEKGRFTYYPYDSDERIFFHPNASMFRMKRVLKEEGDPFISTAGIERGMTVLDCTLGLGADSTIASLAVGEEGAVTALEIHPVIAFLVRNGYKQYETHHSEIMAAMRRIHVLNEDYCTYLKQQADNTFDIVYFDPMFTDGELQSDGLKGLKHVAGYESLTADVVGEAMRVAKKRVVLKDHFRSQRFKQFGFHQYIRKTSAFHYGVINVMDKQEHGHLK
ncbi:class I SAM-dependent methyltransferase [Bacillus tianshenii]|nr:class I SAM-dependent methyltransferase [Bacillus tianshenii]